MKLGIKGRSWDRWFFGESKTVRTAIIALEFLFVQLAPGTGRRLNKGTWKMVQRMARENANDWEHLSAARWLAAPPSLKIFMRELCRWLKDLDKGDVVRVVVRQGAVYAILYPIRSRHREVLEVRLKAEALFWREAETKEEGIRKK